VAGTEPVEEDTYYRALPVCTATGALASAGCPSGVVVERVFEFPPAEIIPWAREHGLTLPPLPEYGAGTALAPRLSPGNARAVRIVRPDAGLTARITRSLPESVQELTIEVLVTGPPPDALRIEVDGVVLGEFPAGPYQLLWRLVPGTHRIRAVAIRAGAGTSMSEVDITVLPAIGP
jgi:hypothetical protein